MSGPEPERPEFPWAATVLGLVVVFLVLAIARSLLGLAFGIVRLVLIVLVAVTVGAAIVNAKSGR
ncbi:MAG: hypothetical protein ACRD0U_01315 [Acidimicrobiales bacterium]